MPRLLAHRWRQSDALGHHGDARGRSRTPLLLALGNPSVYVGTQMCSKVATSVKKGVQRVPNGTEAEAKMSKMDALGPPAPTFAPRRVTLPRTGFKSNEKGFQKRARDRQAISRNISANACMVSADCLPIECSFSPPDCRPRWIVVRAGYSSSPHCLTIPAYKLLLN